MSAVLMTLFAVSILGALGMAWYGLRVLVGRWDQPRRFPPAPQLRPAPIQPAPPAPQPLAPPPVWVAPMGPAPAPLMIPQGVATPRPIVLPTALPPPVAHAGSMPPRPPMPHPVPGTHAELGSRLARGSIPPDFAEELEPDTDPLIPAPVLTPGLVRSEPEVQRGARFSVVRSNRR